MKVNDFVSSPALFSVGQRVLVPLVVCEDNAVPVVKTPLAVEAWYHRVGLLSKTLSGTFKQIGEQKIALPKNSEQIVAKWFDQQNSFDSGVAISVRDLLTPSANYQLNTSVSCCGLHGFAVEDWLKRVIVWDEVFETLGITDEQRVTVCKLVEESLNADSDDIRLEAIVWIEPEEDPSDMLQDCASLILGDLAFQKQVSKKQVCQQLQPDLSLSSEGKITYSLQAKAYFPRSMTCSEVPLRLELVVRYNTTVRLQSSLYLPLDGLLRGEPLHVPLRDIWQAVLGGCSTEEMPCDEMDVLRLVEAYSLGQRCLVPSQNDRWLKWFAGRAEKVGDQSALEQVLSWVKQFKLQRQSTFGKIVLSYQLTHMLRGHFRDAELLRLWSAGGSLAKWPDGLPKVLVQALAKDKLAPSFVDSLLQVVCALTIALSAREQRPDLCLDYSDGQEMFSVGCGGDGRLLLASNLAEAMPALLKGLTHSPQAISTVLKGILDQIGPKERGGDLEAALYLQSFGLNPNVMVEVADEYLSSEEPEICRFGFLLHELLYRLQPDVEMRGKLFLRLPVALSGLVGEGRTHFLQGFEAMLGGSKYERMRDCLPTLNQLNEGVVSYWIQYLVGSSFGECKRIGIGLWRSMLDGDSHVGLRLLRTLNDFALGLEILLGIHDKSAEFYGALKNQLERYPSRPQPNDRLMLSRLFTEYFDIVSVVVRQFDVNDFLKLFGQMPEEVRLRCLVSFGTPSLDSVGFVRLREAWLDAMRRALDNGAQEEVWAFLVQVQSSGIALEKLFVGDSALVFADFLIRALPQGFDGHETEVLVALGKNFELQALQERIQARVQAYLASLLAEKSETVVLADAFRRFSRYMTLEGQRELLLQLEEIWLERKCEKLAVGCLYQLLKVGFPEREVETVVLTERVIRFLMHVDRLSVVGFLTHRKLEGKMDESLWFEVGELELAQGAGALSGVLEPLLLGLHAWALDKRKLAILAADCAVVVGANWSLPSDALQELATVLCEAGESERLFGLLETLMRHKKLVQIDLETSTRIILSSIASVDVRRLSSLAIHCKITDSIVVEVLIHRYLAQDNVEQAEVWLDRCGPKIAAGLKQTIAMAYFKHEDYANCFRLLEPLAGSEVDSLLQQLLDVVDPKQHARIIAKILTREGDWKFSENSIPDYFENLLLSGSSPNLLFHFLQKFPTRSLSLWSKIWPLLGRKLNEKKIEELFSLFLQMETAANKDWDISNEMKEICWSSAIFALQRCKNPRLPELLSCDYRGRLGLALTAPTERTNKVILVLFEAAIAAAVKEGDLGQIFVLVARFHSLRPDWVLENQDVSQKVIPVQIFLSLGQAIFNLHMEVLYDWAAKELIEVFDWLKEAKTLNVSIDKDLHKTIAGTVDALAEIEALPEYAFQVAEIVKAAQRSKVASQHYVGLLTALIRFKDTEVDDAIAWMVRGCMLEVKLPLRSPVFSSACERLSVYSTDVYEGYCYAKILKNDRVCEFMDETKRRMEQVRLLEKGITALLEAKKIWTVESNLRELMDQDWFAERMFQTPSKIIVDALCSVEDSLITEDKLDGMDVYKDFLPLLRTLFISVQAAHRRVMSLFDEPDLHGNSNARLAYKIAAILLKHHWKEPRLARRVHLWVGSWIVSLTRSESFSKHIKVVSEGLYPLLARTWVLLELAPEHFPQSDQNVHNECQEVIDEFRKVFISVGETPLIDHLVHVDYRAAALCVDKLKLDESPELRMLQIQTLLPIAFDFLLDSPSSETCAKAYRLLSHVSELTKNGKSHELLLDYVGSLLRACKDNPFFVDDSKSLTWRVYNFLRDYRKMVEDMPSKAQGMTVLQTLLDELLNVLRHQVVINPLLTEKIIEEYAFILKDSQTDEFPLPLANSLSMLIFAMMEKLRGSDDAEYDDDDLAKLLSVLLDGEKKRQFMQLTGISTLEAEDEDSDFMSMLKQELKDLEE